MKFKYKKYGIGIIRPVIPVDIKYNNRIVGYEALIDSGADFCIFDAQIADILEIDLSDTKTQMVSGIIGRPEPYYIHKVQIIIGGWPFFMEVGFLRNIAHLGYGVLGQKGFFNRFTTKFDYQKEEIELKPINNEQR